jgi:signal transduction histidine kinase
MSTYSNEILFAIIATSIVFTLLVTLIGVLIFFHKQKVKRLDMEREIMQAQYKQTLLQARLEIQEQTFNNISREIHDNVGQLLSLAKVQVNIIDQSETTNKSLLYELKQNIGNALVDLRDIAKSLSGERMMLIGLQQTLQQEVDRINRSQILNASLSITGDVKKISEQKQLIIVRIIQEALQNILKHSEAKNVDISVSYTNTIIELKVRDDGKGFNTEEKLSSNNGLGLQNMINRAGIIGGKASIDSTINNGTAITLKIPYE